MTRGKRLLSLLLSVLMLCTLLPPRASAAPTLYFTAVNDRMCDLNDETMPFWQNGLLYVAGATVDGPDDLGIRYLYNQEKSVAILYKGQRVLYCDLTAGTMENNRTGEQYAGSPIVRSGMVFFPITALAKMFDLKYSSTKIAYGYLLRIRDDNAVLSDEYFIDAATDPIQKRYAQYERAHAAAESEQPETPPPVDTPTRRDDLTVYLLLPAAEEAALTQLLSTLENYQSHATLLLTPELLESAGDGVRRAAAHGDHLVAAGNTALHAAYTYAAHIVVVIYGGEQYLQRGFRVARRGGNGAYYRIEHGLHIRAEFVRLHAGYAFLGACINNGEVKLLRRCAKLHEQLQRLVHNLHRPCAGAVYLVNNNDGNLVQLQRLPQHEAGLRHTAFKCVNQQQHAVNHLQYALNLSAEVRMARRIYYVYSVILILYRGIFAEYGYAALPFQVAGVHHALLHLLVRPEYAALTQQAVHQRGLAVVNVGNYGNVTDIFLLHIF